MRDDPRMVHGAIGLRESKGYFSEGVSTWRSKVKVVEVPHEEWCIDGIAVSDLLAERASEEMRAPDSEVTPLSRRWPTSLAVHTLKALLLEEPGDFDDGRVALYVCPLCADLGCGAISTEVVFTESAVEWRNLAWQADDGFFKCWIPPLSLTFDRANYEAFLRRTLVRWRGMPSEVDE